LQKVKDYFEQQKTKQTNENQYLKLNVENSDEILNLNEPYFEELKKKVDKN
jgi:hypothetical protein